MPARLRSFGFAALTTCALALTACGDKTSSSTGQESATPSVADQRFDAYKTAFFDRLWTLNPDYAAALGNHRYDDQLVVPDSAWRARAVAQFGQELATLGKFNPDSLSANNQIDHRMMADQLRAFVWYTDSLRAWEWDPSSYNLGDPIGTLLTGRHAPLPERLRALSAKLSKVPAYYAAGERNLRGVSKEHTELAILQNEGSLALLPGVLDSAKRANLPAAQLTELEQRVAATRAAIEHYVAHLKGIRTFPRSFRLGEALYARKFHHDLSSAYTPKQLYDRAVQHKEELLADMERVSKQLWPKYFPQETAPADRRELIKRMIGKLALNHTTPDSFVTAVRQQIPKLVAFVDEKKLLTQDPSKPLVVRETPLYMRGGGAGASVSAPGPYDTGANTYYNVTPITPADYTPEQAESYLREYNRYTLQILNIHEAIPGHYTQLVYANRSPSLVKSIFGNGSMVEGWAVYSERMMLENHYGHDSPELWLLYYKWNLRTTLNTILDISVHTMNMSDADALALLMNDGFQERAEAAGKWRRVTLSQVQLCSYFDGYSQIMDLRDELQKEQANAFNLKNFHEQFLSYGSAPVRYIRELMRARRS